MIEKMMENWNACQAMAEKMGFGSPWEAMWKFCERLWWLPVMLLAVALLVMWVDGKIHIFGREN